MNNLLGTSIAASESAISTSRAAASAFFASAPFPFPASALFPFPISAPFALLTSAPLPVMASTSALALFSPEKENHNFGYTRSSVFHSSSNLMSQIFIGKHFYLLVFAQVSFKHVSILLIYHEQHEVLKALFKLLSSLKSFQEE